MKSLTEFPEYVVASEKLAEVRHELAQIQERLAAVTLEMMSKSSPTVSDRALKWLEGEETAPNATGKTGLRQEYAELLDKKMIVSQAAMIQARRVSDIRYRCSQEIVAECKPAYVALIKRLAEIVTALGHANEEEARFRAELDEKDIVATPWLTACPFHPAGVLSDEFSAVRLYLGEVAQFFPEIAAKLSKSEKLQTVKGG